MMSILGTTTSGNTQEGIRIVLAGQEKMGKTTLACDAPEPLLVPLEVGYSGVTVNRVKMIDNFSEVIALLMELQAMRNAGQPLPCKTLIFDSCTALERKIHDEVISSDKTFVEGNAGGLTMETAMGGYGKAYPFANSKFVHFLNLCDWLAVHAGINIVLTCHVFTAKLIDPAHGEYDSWDLLLHSPKNQKTYGKREILTQWADVIGFLHDPIFVTQGDKVNVATSANRTRQLALSREPTYVAGNRYGVKGTIDLPEQAGWNCLATAIYNSNQNINIWKYEPQAAQA